MLNVLTAVQRLLERYLVVWLCLLSVVAFIWDDQVVPDPFTASWPWLPGMIAVTMYAIGWLLPPAEVVAVLRRWPLVLAGTAVQYGSMPALAYAVAHSLPLSSDYQLGLVMAGCVPGAMASNVLTLVARGNVSYSIGLTSSSTLLSPIFVPIGLRLTLGRQLDQSLTGVAWELCWMVVVPVVAGFATARRCRDQRAMAEPIGKIVASLAILWIIAVVVATNRQRLDPAAVQLASSTGLQQVALLPSAVLLVNLGGYGVGKMASRVLRLDGKMARALTLEIGMQNAGLGTVLVQRLFPSQPAAMIPTALYTFGCMLTGTVLARWWSTRAPGEDSGGSVSRG